LAAENKVIIKSEEGTKELARQYASGLSAGDVVVLNGSLGSGKTFFIREAAGYFNAASVSSPTFAIVNEYEGRIRIYHFDFYRIVKVEELYDLGFEDYLNDEEAMIFIEWGNLFPEILPQVRKEINIKTGEEKERIFEFRDYK
jgi:tRNA threonylcarbamoyladenosine biosynthesis protein TsaE